MSDGTAVLERVTDERATNTPLLESFAERDDLPAWFIEQQRAGWAEFSKLPMPARKDQAWRFSNVDALKLDGYVRAPQLDEATRGELLDQSSGLAQSAARLVFADEQLVERDVIRESLRDRGVIFQPMERAIIEHEELVRQYFMAEPATLGSAKFAALHRAFVSSGAFLYVPRGVEIELPIEIYHWIATPHAAVFPHLLLVAGEMSKVTVVEYFRSAENAPGFACGVNDLIVGRGANVRYVCVQDWSERVVALQVNATRVERDASAMSLNINAGASYARLESRSRLVGEGARSDMLAVGIANGRREFDARTLQDHERPHTTSDLLYKNALEENARTTFGGLIRVEPHAHFTDAYQTVRNLLLSDDAEANSMPGLEIMADNVKCSHGATSGQIDEEEMFYLLSRGIPPATAKRLIAAGFLDEVIARLSHDAISDHLRQLIARKFRASG
ncbi:MAG: Fe-S cluster assembly protein SufD [Chthoniobacterales bacterium]|nr:MAG: Fe-S cluster assembly protein SufD [Chthoniobacterales bacterium]